MSPALGLVTSRCKLQTNFVSRPGLLLVLMELLVLIVLEMEMAPSDVVLHNFESYRDRVKILMKMHSCNEDFSPSCSDGVTLPLGATILYL